MAVVRTRRYRAAHRQNVEVADLVAAHLGHRLGRQDACAVQRAAAQQHAQEARVVARRAAQPAAAGQEGRAIAGRALAGAEAAIGWALVHRHQPRALGVGQGEAGIGHAERASDAGGQVVVDRHAARRLDSVANDVGGDAVVPARTGIEQQRKPREFIDIPRPARQAERRGGALELGVPGVIAKAGGMGEQMAQRDRAGGGAQHRHVAAEAVQHHWRREMRQHGGDRAIQAELALLNQLHRRHRGDRLGHRGDPEDVVGPQRPPAGEVGDAEAALVQQVAAGGGHGHGPSNCAGVDGAAQGGIDGGRIDHGAAPRQ